ncbi:MAG: hypothetical protein PWR11_337, partial [Bacillota bacterium]|nr:hypothetical protein [Bacillota bacterium]
MSVGATQEVLPDLDETQDEELV